jgi:hypothetical protein
MRKFGAMAVAAAVAAASPAAHGQGLTPAQVGRPLGAAAAPPPSAMKTALALAATFGAGPSIRSGLRWRVFSALPGARGQRQLVAQSAEAQPILRLPPGDYIVHVAYGLAGASQAASVPSQGAASVRLPLAAGALRVTGVLGAAAIPPERLAIDVYAPEPGNSEARLIVKGAKPGDAIGLPEGLYHIVSTYLDTVGVGSLAPSIRGIATNSVVSADLRVETGKLTDVVLRHHAAVLTLKLVNSPGGEALANTVFNVLTPGGDEIRQLVGAFPSLVLAEGDYVVVARHAGKTRQSTFSVQSGVDRDIEVLAK